jgi:hypothetical protein
VADAGKMTRFPIVLPLLIVAGTLAFSQQNTPEQPNAGKQQQRTVIPRQVLQDAVLGFYVSQFQKQTDVSPEIFAKIFPFLQQFVQDRFDISQRRTRALNQLRQTVQRGGSDEDLKRAVHDFDTADADFQANEEKFLSNVDPLLDPKQQAKLRIFQVMADNRMRQMVTTVQNANRGQ